MAAREPGRGTDPDDAEMRVPTGATALLAGAIGYALGTCAVIAPGEMSLPTPCAEWDLKRLVGHLGASMADLEATIRTGRLDLDAEPAPEPDPEDLAEVLRDRAAELLYACYEGCGRGRFVLVGGLPLSAGIVACTGAVEIAVHGWDVSVARGRRRPVPPGLATRMLSLSPLLVAVREGLFAEPVEVSPEASPCDRLVGYLGRSPDWPRNTPAPPNVVTGE
jgi:uncharacterized protein (TIGR03086 family)